ncbi:MAG: hypothetical protein IT458_18620, partial [Planctomycetes bacterium]|nr:hypothetical protein [Planctomycetota bacterium]
RAGKAPAALLFVHELNRNTAPMIRGLDQLGLQLAWTGLQTFTIRIAADRTEAEAAVQRSSAALQMARPILVSTEGPEGPGAYALQRKATLTLVLARDGTVVRSVGLTDTGRADLPRLRAWLEEVAGPVPADPQALRRAMTERLTRDPEELRALAIDLLLALQRAEREGASGARRMAGEGAARPQRPAAGAEAAGAGDAARAGKAPDDEQLRALLRRSIQLSADAAELDAVFQAVETRVGGDAGLRRQAVEMFRLVLGLGYGNDDAKARARAYVEKHGGKER